MLSGKIVDYTAFPVGKETRNGVIERCTRCGKPGIHVHFSAPGITIEKWVHAQKKGFLGRAGRESACVRSENVVDGRTLDGWGWSVI